MLLLVNYFGTGHGLAPTVHPNHPDHPLPSVNIIVRPHFTIVFLLMMRHPLTLIRHASMSFSFVIAGVPFVKKKSPGSVVATSSSELWQIILQSDLETSRELKIDIGAMVSYIFTYRDSRTIRML